MVSGDFTFASGGAAIVNGGGAGMPMGGGALPHAMAAAAAVSAASNVLWHCPKVMACAFVPSASALASPLLGLEARELLLVRCRELLAEQLAEGRLGILDHCPHPLAVLIPVAELAGHVQQRALLQVAVELLLQRAGI